jgi:hypothetical protein
LENINKIDKPLAELTKGRTRPELIKLELKKKVSQPIPMNFIGSVGNTLKTYSKL